MEVHSEFDAIDWMRRDQEVWYRFFKRMGLGKLFCETFWDGFESFDDYFLYGDLFPHKLKIMWQDMPQQKLLPKPQLLLPAS